jgi:hypothetical protein
MQNISVHTGQPLCIPEVRCPYKYSVGRNEVLKTIFRFLLVIGMTVCMLPIAHAQKLETGWLSDQKGSVDPTTKVTVVLVAGLNGVQQSDGGVKWAGRHIGLEIPLASINVHRLVLIGEDGNPIPHRYPEAFSSPIGHSGEKGTYLKLFVDRSPGFKFKIRTD